MHISYTKQYNVNISRKYTRKYISIYREYSLRYAHQYHEYTHPGITPHGVSLLFLLLAGGSATEFQV